MPLERRVDFTFTLDQERLRTARRREGRYLLRSNLTDTDPRKALADVSPYLPKSSKPPKITAR